MIKLTMMPMTATATSALSKAPESRITSSNSHLCVDRRVIKPACTCCRQHPDACPYIQSVSIKVLLPLARKGRRAGQLKKRHWGHELVPNCLHPPLAAYHCSCWQPVMQVLGPPLQPGRWEKFVSLCKCHVHAPAIQGQRQACALEQPVHLSTQQSLLTVTIPSLFHIHMHMHTQNTHTYAHMHTHTNTSTPHLPG